MNTLLHPTELDRSSDPRLDELAALDPAAAAQLRAFSADPSGEPSFPFDEQAMSAPVAGWLGEKHSPLTPEIIILMGEPSARELTEILRGTPDKSHVFLLEWDMRRAAQLFRQCPMETFLKNDRLVIAWGQDASVVELKFFRMLDVHESPAYRILDAGRAPSVAMDFYVSTLQLIRKNVRLDVFNAGTLVCRGPLWQFNTLKNLPRLITQPGIDALKGLFAGKPALVLAAGPSLDEALKVIPRIRDGFVVISTGTALKPARRAGIRPDLVVSVDASHLTGPQFDTKCDDLFLCCSSLAFSPILEKVRGLFSGRLDASPIDHWLDSNVTPRGAMFAGGTVTASAMDMASKLGCNPVITVGLDLCFADDGTTHANDTMYHGRRIDPEKLIRVPGNFKEDVFTTNQFRCYIQLLEEYLEHNRTTQFINATHGGAKIRGMKLISPSGLGCLAAAPFDAYREIERIHGAYARNDRQIEKMCAELELVLRQLETVVCDCREAAMLCNQLILLLKTPQAGDLETARDMMRRVEEIDRRITEARDSSVFLRMSLWPSSFQSNSKKADHEQNYSDAMLAHRRARELYEQIGGAARWTGDLLGQVVREMQRAPDREDRIESESAGETTFLSPFQEVCHT